MVRVIQAAFRECQAFSRPIRLPLPYADMRSSGNRSAGSVMRSSLVFGVSNMPRLRTLWIRPRLYCGAVESVCVFANTAGLRSRKADTASRWSGVIPQVLCRTIPGPSPRRGPLILLC